MTTATITPNTETQTKHFTLQDVVTRNIKVAMALYDAKQKDLANALGVERSSISQKITRRVAWSLEDVEKAGRFFGISPARFLEPNGLLNSEWGRSGLNRGPAGPGSKPLRGIMQCFTLAA